MELRQLRYFVRIAELGSFSRAAVDLRIAQSALSYQMSRMEDELRVKLVERHRRGIILTEAGRSVLDHARRVIQELNELRVDAVSREKYPSGHVLFALPPSVARSLAPQIVERFRNSYPDVRLSMREGTADLIYDWLLKGQIDLGVIYDFPDTAEIEATCLINDRLRLVGSRRLPIPVGSPSVAMLEGLPLVLTSTTHGWRRRFEKALAEWDMRPHIRAEIDSLAVIKELVAAGFGYSFLPQSAVHMELSTGDLWTMDVPELSLPATLMLLNMRHRSLSLAGRELRRLLHEEAGALVANDYTASLQRKRAGRRQAAPPKPRGRTPAQTLKA